MLEIAAIHKLAYVFLVIALALIVLMIMITTYFLAKHCFFKCEVSEKRKKVLIFLSLLLAFLFVFTAIFTPIFFDLTHRAAIIKTGTGPEANLSTAIHNTLYFALTMLFVISIIFLVITSLRKTREPFFTTKTVTRLAVFIALSVVLYFLKFNLPFIFPGFLEIHISDMPALLAGFMMGPQGGAVVIIVRALIKLPFTSTAGIGELGDLILGLVFVVSSATIYRQIRTKKGAVIALAVGAACCTIAAMIVNRLILIPFFATMFSWNAVIGMVSNLYPNITKDSFYTYFLLLATLPFNILRCALSVFVAFFLYRPTKRVFGFVEKKAGKGMSKNKV